MDKNAYIVQDKYKGRTLTADSFRDTIRDFFIQWDTIVDQFYSYTGRKTEFDVYRNQTNGWDIDSMVPAYLLSMMG